MMKVKDVMNKNLVLLRPNMSLREASRILIENKISGAPVVDSNGKFLGLLMLSDIIRFIKDRFVSAGIIALPTPFDFIDFYQYDIPFKTKQSLKKEIEETKVSDIMCRKTHTVDPEEDLWSVIYILAKKGVSHIPVVDSEKRVIGIVTRGDVIKALSQSDEISN